MAATRHRAARTPAWSDPVADRRMTSSSAFGLSSVTLQFDLNRDIDGAAQDVQAAINAAASTLPKNLPYPPVYSKVNPADTRPSSTVALTSQTISMRADVRSRGYADRPAPQRSSTASAMSGILGEASSRRSASRRTSPASRIMGSAWRIVRNAIANANVAGAKGSLDGKPAILHDRRQRSARDGAKGYEPVVVIAYRKRRPGAHQRCRPCRRGARKRPCGRLVSGHARRSSSTCNASLAPISSRP